MKAKAIGYCALVMVLALYVVGIVSHGPILLGLRQRKIAKWAAVPCFIAWLTLMTLAVGIASLTGLVASCRWRTSFGLSKALIVTVIFAVLWTSALRKL